jgi:hypothetical protein
MFLYDVCVMKQARTFEMAVKLPGDHPEVITFAKIFPCLHQPSSDFKTSGRCSNFVLEAARMLDLACKITFPSVVTF